MNSYYLRKNQETLSADEKQYLINIANKFNLDYSNGVSLDNFSEACYNDNSIDELVEALETGATMDDDINAWNIDEAEWTAEIKKALTSMIRTGLNLD